MIKFIRPTTNHVLTLMNANDQVWLNRRINGHVTAIDLEIQNSLHNNCIYPVIHLSETPWNNCYIFRVYRVELIFRPPFDEISKSITSPMEASWIIRLTSPDPVEMCRPSQHGS